MLIYRDEVARGTSMFGLLAMVENTLTLVLQVAMFQAQVLIQKYSMGGG